MAWRVAFMVHWGGTPMAFTAFVALTGLDFHNKILGPPGLQVFIFGRQDKYSSCQKLSSRKKIEYNTLKV